MACLGGVIRVRFSTIAILKAGDDLPGTDFNECRDELAPTESWNDLSQDCLHDVRIVGNIQLLRDSQNERVGLRLALPKIARERQSAPND